MLRTATLRTATLLAVLLLASGASRAQALFEAEDAALVGNAAVATERAGYSGTGYVTGIVQPGDSLRFTVDASGDFVQIRLAVAANARFASYTVQVDDQTPISTNVPVTGAFREIVVAERRLSPGSHTITVHGSFEVDYLTFAPVSYPGPAVPPPVLSDPDASPSARALFAFLLDEYGEHILSAQQDIYSGSPRTAEIDYVTSVTGKVPAIGGFDLIDYSPSRIQFGGAPRDWSEEWIGWAQTDADGKEGIVNLMWHWNAPTDLYNTADQPWYRGFYTEATSFDFADALAEGPGGANYDLLLRDIDAIAVQLQKFEDADIPVLWRPLHEAAGGFFWWGAQSGADYVELWRLVYDRLTDVHDLHNLIWVWTYEPASDPLAWYPGDDYVDVVGRDFYSDDPETLITSQWELLQDAFGANKLVSLTESGTLPDMDDSADRGIWWSWFNVWNGFERDIPADRLTRIYTSEVVLTRDELPDWRDYTLATASEPTPEAQIPLALYPNPTSGATTLTLTLAATVDVTVDVFDLTGRLVSRQRLGVQPAGALQAAVTAPTASGTYLVRVAAGDRVSHGRLVVTR
ncbi:glycosyl hydrolase [Rubricoccus marinus]|uniref:GH26 domain-containing protein n=1 Tax=Rubricoccus marinus TaxID=716817 RepID=A0A259TUB4_9BACT|nr:glycosyl hydrolase [Rubricoccus marinus]OZC01333.1 hypothetical protein BSZ36_17985 [Rubricoccus marinus]